MNLSEIWRFLEEDSLASGVAGRIQRRVLASGRRNFFLGLETPSRNRMLILRVDSQTVENPQNIADSRGLTVRMTARVGDNAQGTEVVLTLTEPEHRDLFDLLIRDLIAAAEQPENENTGLTRFLARLADWQLLFRRLSPQGLTAEAQQGLWGELWSLREVLAPVTGVKDAIDGWRGPMGADQDFQMGSTCIEVKTSSSATFEHLTISSERQLEAPDDVTLFLLGLSLDRRVKHGETLPEMVDSIRNMASEFECLDQVDVRLDLSGYVRQDAPLYSEIGYTLRSLHAFKVEDGFPRIVSSSLEEGVGDVRYTVSLASCREFSLPERDPEKLFEGLL